MGVLLSCGFVRHHLNKNATKMSVGVMTSSERERLLKEILRKKYEPDIEKTAQEKAVKAKRKTKDQEESDDQEESPVEEE